MSEEEILQMLERREYKELKAEFENWHPVDIANLLEEFNERQRILIFRLLAKEEAAETFTYMSSEMRKIWLRNLLTPRLQKWWKKCIWMISRTFWKKCRPIW